MDHSNQDGGTLAASADLQPGGRLETGKVLVTSLRLYRTLFLPVLLILLFFSIPELLYAEFSVSLKWQLVNAGMNLQVAGWIKEGLEIFIQVLFFGLGQGAVCFAISRMLAGQGATFPGSVVDTFGLFGPLAAVSVLYIAGVVAGLFGLVIPGLVIIMIWFVVIPVCVFERLPVIACFRRSAELTRGYRWPLFGLFLIVQLSIMVTEVLLDLLLPSMGPIDDFISWVAVVILYAFDAVLVVVTYRELLQLKGAGDNRELARVFD